MLKRVLFGVVEGRNYQGRPRKCWVDDILKWCDKTLQQASHHAQDRVKWKNLIAGPYGSWTTGQEEEEEEEDPTTQFFTGQMPFLPPNQQHQSTVNEDRDRMTQT